MKKVKSTGKEIDFADFLKYSQTFIETGTCSGRTVKTALQLGYEKVISVEAWYPFYQNCQRIFSNEIKTGIVELFNGNSTEKLPKMLAEVKGPAVFWLDAHPSGPNTAGHDDLMANPSTSEFHQDKIILAELEIILAHNKGHVIIIDDQAGETNSVALFIDKIESVYPGKYRYFFTDERMGENYYKDKILICLPD